MKYIALAVFLGFHALVDCRKGGCRVPKTTFTSVVELPKDSHYIEKYIKVAWCLYPHDPEKTEKLYVQISSKHSHNRRYFEILNHKKCRCRQYNTSTAGYDELRKANIRQINKPNNEIVNYMPGIRCNDGPHIYRKWLYRESVRQSLDKGS